MIRTLRRRFIFGAMLAFTILLLVLVGGIIFSGYINMEQSADAFLLQQISEYPMHVREEPPSSPDSHPPQSEEPPAKPEATAEGKPEKPEKPAKELSESEFLLFFGYRISAQDAPTNYCELTLDPDGALISIDKTGLSSVSDETLLDLSLRILAEEKNLGKIDAYKYCIGPAEDGAQKIILLDISIQARMLADLLLMAAFIGLACEAGLFLIMLPVSKRIVRSFAVNAEKQKQFITNAGHDIKTPVAIIQSNVDAMELIQGESKWSRNIRGQTERLTQLLQQLLSAARIDERSLAPKFEKIDLAALLKSVAETYSELIAQRNLTLRWSLPDRMLLRADRECLRQLLHILFDNATAYANDGGTISIQLEKRLLRLRMNLSNTVDSLPSAPPDALFDRFYRGNDARTQASGGCGIGLSAAKAIIELHRGKIEASYDGENIVRFTIDLPL